MQSYTFARNIPPHKSNLLTASEYLFTYYVFKVYCYGAITHQSGFCHNPLGIISHKNIPQDRISSVLEKNSPYRRHNYFFVRN